MPLKIRLSLWNSRGAVAAVEDSDGSHSVDVALTRENKSAKTVCKRAAERLRQLANKFEVLANSDEPFKCTTQDEINRISC